MIVRVVRAMGDPSATAVPRLPTRELARGREFSTGRPENYAGAATGGGDPGFARSRQGGIRHPGRRSFSTVRGGSRARGQGGANALGEHPGVGDRARTVDRERKGAAVVEMERDDGVVAFELRRR